MQADTYVLVGSGLKSVGQSRYPYQVKVQVNDTLLRIAVIKTHDSESRGQEEAGHK